MLNDILELPLMQYTNIGYYQKIKNKFCKTGRGSVFAVMVRVSWLSSEFGICSDWSEKYYSSSTACIRKMLYLLTGHHHKVAKYSKNSI